MDNFDKKQYLILTVVVLAMLGVGFFRCKPLVAKAQDLRRFKADQMLATERITSQMHEMPVVSRRMEKLQVEVGDYLAKIPRERQFAGLWDQIAGVMNKYELKEQLIQPNEEILGDEINSITITIKCKGLLTQLYGFLKDLDQFERVIRVEQLRLTNGTTEFGQVSMDAKAKIYYQFADQEQVKVDQ